MGIPAFYRWLAERYPLTTVDAIEDEAVNVNGVEVPIDSSKPNPNGMEYDNLYLDMNGIIHPCFHPEGEPAPKDYEEVFKAVFKYIDRIFSIVRPRKLLYMAIDGVAPRAKMNQQRTRRFRAAKEAADEAAAEEERLISEGKSLDASERTQTLDSNIITPGTEFMAILSSALQYYVRLRMNNDPGWRGIKVILSDANVPGEGEHKIMSYIRLQRNLPGFDPNTRHCLYGLDADLIMLALSTHEIHFSILREDLRKAFNDKMAKFGKERLKSERDQKLEAKQSDNGKDYISKQEFLFLNIWVLRDYLSHDLKIPDSTVNIDLERLIDDFVFMCVFVGNDFLPHVPSLDIYEGAITLLMSVYKTEFVKMGGYLTNSFEVNLKRVEHFLQIVGSYENAIFRRRSQVKKIEERRTAMFLKSKSRSDEPKKKPGVFRSSFNPSISKPNSPAPGASGAKFQSPINGTAIDDKISVVDNIKLGEEGWKGRFYAEKFEAKNEDAVENIRKHAVLKYIEGICWVMHYYYQGVCSWQWFYPYHYAPFASDFYGLDRLEIHFTLGEPFKPFDQLMGVLPAASAPALPLLYRKLMIDAMSPILDFYPTDVEVDMNGKRHAWQAICKLPFIKESRLIAEIANVEHSLTDEERRRNSLGLDVLFVHISHSLATKVFSFCKRKKDHPKLLKAKVKRKINPIFSGGMNGYMYISDKPVLPVEIVSPIEDMEIINKNKVISVFYKHPPIHPHAPRPPKGVVIPKMFVSKEDIKAFGKLWHEYGSGREVSERKIGNNVSGSSLAKSAHQLVKECDVEKRQQNVAGHTNTDASCPTNSKVKACKKMTGNDEQSDTTGTKRRKKKLRDVGYEESTKGTNNGSMNRDSSLQMNSIGNGTKPGKKRKQKDGGDDQSIQNVDNGHVNRDPSCQLNSIENVSETSVGNDEKSDVNCTKAGKKRKLRDVGGHQSIKDVDNGHVDTDASCENLKETLMGNDEKSDFNGTQAENRRQRKDVCNGDDQNIKAKKQKKKSIPVEDSDQNNIKDKKPKQKIILVEDNGEIIKYEKRKEKSTVVEDDGEIIKDKKQKKKGALMEDDGKSIKDKKQEKKNTLVKDDKQMIKNKKEKKKRTLLEDPVLVN